MNDPVLPSRTTSASRAQEQTQTASQPLFIPCTWCMAIPGQACRTMGIGRWVGPFHFDRVADFRLGRCPIHLSSGTQCTGRMYHFGPCTQPPDEEA